MATLQWSAVVVTLVFAGGLPWASSQECHTGCPSATSLATPPPPTIHPDGDGSAAATLLVSEDLVTSPLPSLDMDTLYPTTSSSQGLDRSSPSTVLPTPLQGFSPSLGKAEEGAAGGSSHLVDPTPTASVSKAFTEDASAAETPTLWTRSLSLSTRNPVPKETQIPSTSGDLVSATDANANPAPEETRLPTSLGDQVSATDADASRWWLDDEMTMAMTTTESQAMEESGSMSLTAMMMMTTSSSSVAMATTDLASIGAGTHCRCRYKCLFSLAMLEIDAKVSDDLAVDRRNTSSFRRRHVSMPDHRKSSRGIGSVVVIALAVPVVFMVSGDVLSVVGWLRARASP